MYSLAGLQAIVPAALMSTCCLARLHHLQRRSITTLQLLSQLQVLEVCILSLGTPVEVRHTPEENRDDFFAIELFER
jgi:hypothetical protein